EGQAGSILGKQDEGQAGSNPGNAAELQPQPSLVVHAGPNRKPMDLAVSDASTQQNPEQMDEEFTTTAYPNVQENLKLPTKDQDTSSIPPMTTPVLDLTTSQSDSPTVNAPLLTSIATTITITTTTTTLPPPPPQPQQSTTNLILLQCIDLDEARRKKRKKCVLPRTPSGSPPLQPPLLPPPVGTFGAPSTSR
nr:hypothetical protein [Tanacetum cinerariifolium]